MRERLIQQLIELSAEFLRYNGNNSSIITVTGVKISKDEKFATILFTVFPQEFEKTALEFAKRKRSEFKEYIREKSKINRIPHIDFALDIGEKNRQFIDKIVEKEKEI